MMKIAVRQNALFHRCNRCRWGVYENVVCCACHLSGPSMGRRGHNRQRLVDPSDRWNDGGLQPKHRQSASRTHRPAITRQASCRAKAAGPPVRILAITPHSDHRSSQLNPAPLSSRCPCWRRPAHRHQRSACHHRSLGDHKTPRRQGRFRAKHDAPTEQTLVERPCHRAVSRRQQPSVRAARMAPVWDRR